MARGEEARPADRDPGPEALIRRALKTLLLDIHSPASLEEVWPRIVTEEACRRLLRRWNGWSPQKRREGWEKAARAIEEAAYATRPYCLRCGTCCRKGSPSLYREDLLLLRRGGLTRLDLVTLRRGERVYSNEIERLIYLPEEQVKVREKPGSRECLFFQPEGPGCGIYEHRPRQCRVMECWNPAGYRALKKDRPVSRRDLLDPEDPLMPVVRAHEERCSVLRLQEGLERATEQTLAEDENLGEAIAYDRHVRSFLGEKFSLRRQHLDFLLGRPVEEVIGGLGFTIQFEPGNRIIIKRKE